MVIIIESEHRTPSSWFISPWGSRSLLERCFVVLVACLLLSASSGQAPDSTITPSKDTFQSMCLTDTCIYTASEMSRSLDRNVDPCDDFYAFACGGWIKNNPIPEGESTWGTVEKVDMQNQLIIRNALEKIDLDNVKSKAEHKARIFFDTCLDVETIETLGGTPLQELIKNVGGWNISASGYLPHKFDLQRTLQILQSRYGIDGFFSWDVAVDDRNSSTHLIKVTEGYLDMPTRDNYLNKRTNKKILDAYLEYMTKISVLLGADETDARTQMLDVIELETELANITTPDELNFNVVKEYNAMSVQELQELSPFIRWQDYFNDVFKIVSRKISTKERVVVKSKEFFVNLNTLVNRYAATEKGNNTLNNYLIWQTAKTVSPYLSKVFRHANKALRKATFGSKGGEERWHYCTTETDNAIDFVVGAMFVRESFNGEARSEAQTMIKNIRSAIKNNLQTLSWLDKETKDQAVLKEDTVIEMIGFPDYILNAQELDKHYFELNVKPNEYFQNNIEVRVFDLRKNLEKLDELVDNTQWIMSPTSVNAQYNPNTNRITVPAGILQHPFYDGKNPKSINYGAIGMIMGHELTHALDDNGREYDRFGNLNNWWTNESIHQFDLRTACIKDQYSNYSEEGIKINGEKTTGENIADNGGLKSSFHAYLKYSAAAAKNYTLPGLNYSHRQLFFISFAQNWCAAMTKEQTVLMGEINSHSAPKFRVIGPISNLPEFSTEFSCPPGSNMNPIKKCGVW